MKNNFRIRNDYFSTKNYIDLISSFPRKSFELEHVYPYSIYHTKTGCYFIPDSKFHYFSTDLPASFTNYTT